MNRSNNRRERAAGSCAKLGAPPKAVIYTLVENCRRRDLDPFTYLRAVLTRLPNMTNHQIHEVTPQA
jgi:hypothetical protein